MRIYFKFLALLVVAIQVFSAHAGSYEDFFAAIQQDDAPAIRSLLQRGFDPNTPGPQKLDGLYMALRAGNLKAAQVLAEWPKTNIETRTPEDESPLMMAALKGHAALARLLIQRGADVNKTGWTPLHYAATGGNLDIIRLLLEEHAYIDAESPNRTTPLMMAAQYGSPAAVQLLLEEGADPALRNQLGLTAGDFAARGNRPDSAALILKALRGRQPQGRW